MVFREVQRFSQPWLWGLILLPTCLGCIGLFGWGMVQQLVLGRPWGDRPMSDVALLVVSGYVALVTLVRLMVRRRNQMMEEFRCELNKEKRRKRAEEMSRKFRRDQAA